MLGRVGIALALLALGGCGNLPRDIIVEKSLPDSGAVADAGSAAPPEAPDARGSVPREPGNRCSEDGGCPPVRCTLHDCSPSCPLGCGGSLPSTSTGGERMRLHRRPREVSP